MPITIGSNIASIRGQRELSKTGSALSSVFERLSSGQRINKASDDAAGLAIAESLSVDQRIYAQGIRNINDGISLLSMKEGATSELLNILTRIRELSTQASNGILGDQQRNSINEESEQLVQEYNRILETTEFNSLKLFSDQATSIRIQLGYGVLGGITLSFGKEGALVDSVGIGDGTFTDQAIFGVGSGPTSVAVGDFNGDGISDLASTNFNSSNLSILLGNGDGTFATHSTILAGTWPDSLTVGDFNGDGISDLVSANYNSNNLSVLLGNGDGTFAAQTSFAVGDTPESVATGDFNGDGILDLVSANTDSNNLSVLLGNGDGTFAAQTSLGVGTAPMSVVVGDFNGDGISDLASANFLTNNLSILLGNGDGTFATQTSFGVGTRPTSVAIGDFNGDGISDLASANLNSNNLSILLGNGDGTFSAQSTIGVGARPTSVAIGDFNGDGISDLVSANRDNNNLSVLLGNGDGTFTAQTTFGVGTGPASVAISDFNGDGISDLISANRSSNNLSILLGNGTEAETIVETTQVSRLSSINDINLTTQNNAINSQSRIDQYMEDVNVVRSLIGAGTSRFYIAMNKLEVEIESYASAESQIRDVDIALESAELTRNTILQQSASAVLAQANLLPELVLKLLS